MASKIHKHALLYLVELAVAKHCELSHDIEPQVEEHVEQEDPAVQGGQAELKDALCNEGPIELTHRHQAIGNRGHQVLLHYYQQQPQDGQSPDKVPEQDVAGPHMLLTIGAHELTCSGRWCIPPMILEEQLKHACISSLLAPCDMAHRRWRIICILAQHAVHMLYEAMPLHDLHTVQTHMYDVENCV